VDRDSAVDLRHHRAYRSYSGLPGEHTSISVSVFMILTGLAFFLLGKDLEKLSKGVEKAVVEKVKEAR